MDLAALTTCFEALVAQDPLPPPAAPDAAPAAPLPPVPPPRPQVQSVDFQARGFQLDVLLRSGQVLAAAELMERDGYTLELITGVDWLAAQEMEVVYDYLHFHGGARVVVRTRVPRGAPELPTIRSIHPGADWHERETHEFFGIRFLGHPNLTPLLLPEDATFHPLRKDFTGV